MYTHTHTLINVYFTQIQFVKLVVASYKKCRSIKLNIMYNIKIK